MTLLLLLATAHATTTVDRIAAVVNDEVITLSEVYDLGRDFIEAQCRPLTEKCALEKELEVLDAAIKRVLIRQELAKLDMSVTGQQVDQAIDTVIKQHNLQDRQALRREIERTGMKWETYREQLTEQLRVQAFQQMVVGPLVTVTDDEVRDRYQRTVREVKPEPVLTIDFIGIPLPETATPEQLTEAITAANKVVSELNGKTLEWQAAVEKYDGIRMNEAMGGREYRRKDLNDTLKSVALVAEVGKAQAPVKLKNNLVILRVTKKEMVKGDVQAFEDIEPQLRDQLFQEKVREVEEEWYQRTRRNTAVEVLLDQ